MRVIGVSLFTKRLCFRPELEAASSQILWTNDTGSKGGRVLKKMTAGDQPGSRGFAAKVLQLTALSVDTDI